MLTIILKLTISYTSYFGSRWRSPSLWVPWYVSWRSRNTYCRLYRRWLYIGIFRINLAWRLAESFIVSWYGAFTYVVYNILHLTFPYWRIQQSNQKQLVDYCPIVSERTYTPLNTSIFLSYSLSLQYHAFVKFFKLLCSSLLILFGLQALLVVWIKALIRLCVCTDQGSDLYTCLSCGIGNVQKCSDFIHRWLTNCSHHAGFVSNHSWISTSRTHSKFAP